MLYLYAVLILLLFLIALFYVDLKAALTYVRNDTGEWVELCFYTREGHYGYSYVVPVINIAGGKIRFRFVRRYYRKISIYLKSDYNQRLPDILKKINKSKEVLNIYKDLFEDIKKYLGKIGIRAELCMELRGGVGDAALTGVMSGLFWTLTSLLLVYVSKFFEITKKKITITPSFNDKGYEVDAACIFYMKLAHIIVVLIKILHHRIRRSLKAKKTEGGGIYGRTASN